MIKLVAIGLWVCLVSLGSSYVMASMQAGASSGEGSEPTYFDGLDYRATDGITVPMISENTIKGYILARFVYTVDGETANSLTVPPDPFLLDAAFRTLYSTEGFSFERPERYDLTALTTGIRDTVNERFGQEIIHEVLVEQFDYIAKKDIRGSKTRRQEMSPEETD